MANPLDAAILRVVLGRRSEADMTIIQEALDKLESPPPVQEVINVNN